MCEGVGVAGNRAALDAQALGGAVPDFFLRLAVNLNQLRVVYLTPERRLDCL